MRPSQEEEASTVLDDPLVEMELTVLSGAVFSKQDLALAVETLEPDDFSLPTNREAFRVMRDMFVAGEAVDKLTLKGRISAMTWFSLSPPTSFATADYIERIREAGQVRKLRDLGTHLSESPGDSTRLADILDEGISRLLRSDARRAMSLHAALCALRSERKEGAVHAKSIDYPWSKVNLSTRGLRAGWLCYLAGRPREGKTAAAIELAFSAAKQGKKVLFDSLEMDNAEVAVRIAQRFGLDSQAFYMGDMRDEDWWALDKAAGHEALDNIYLEFAPTVAKLTALVRSRRPDLVIVDYVQLMEHTHSDRVEGTTQTSHALKRLARRYEVPVLAISQLSRDPKEKRGRIPDLSDLRDSGALEQDADQVIFIWRERDHQNNLPMQKGMFVVAKARMGEAGKQVFSFDGRKQMFLVAQSEGS